MAHEYNWEEQGLCRTYTDAISGEEVFNSNLVIHGDPRFDDIRYVINDFTNITEFIVGKVDILNIAAIDNFAAIDNIACKSNPVLKIAIVAIFEPLLEWINLYIDSMQDSLCQCKFFENIDDAYTWVNEIA